MKTITIEADGHSYKATIARCGCGWVAGITRGGIWCGEMRCQEGGSFTLEASNGGLKTYLVDAFSDALLSAVTPKPKKRRTRKKKAEEEPALEEAPQEEEPAPEE